MSRRAAARLPRPRRRAEPRRGPGRPVPTRPHGSRSSRSCRASPRRVDRLTDAGFLVIVRHQPARRRPRDAAPRGGRGDERAAAAPRCRSTTYPGLLRGRRRLPLPQAAARAPARGRRDGTAIDLAGSFMVGDRWRDVEAGRRAGCRTVFLDLRLRRQPAGADPPDVARAGPRRRRGLDS